MERLITRIKTPLVLRDKQKSTIVALSTKAKELDVEIAEVRGQIDEMEASVKEYCATLAKELSEKVKTKCMIVQN